MKYSFDWKDFRIAYQNISKIEEKVILDNFEKIVFGDDDYEGMSSTELEKHFNTFKNAWICRTLLL